MFKVDWVCVALALCCSTASAASAWEPRASEDDRRALFNDLRWALEQSEASRDGALARAAKREAALLDLMAQREGVPEGIYRAAFRAAELQGPDREEQLMRELARAFKLDTPDPVLVRLGVLAQRGEDTVSERLLIALANRAAERPDHMGISRIIPHMGVGGSATTIPVLLGLLNDLNPSTGGGLELAKALAEIASRGHTEEIVTALTRRLKSSSGAQAAYEARALGLIGDPAALPTLETRIEAELRLRAVGSHPTPELSEAVEALGRIGTAKAIGFLFRQLQTVQIEDSPARGTLYQGFGFATREAARVPGLVERLVDLLVEAEDEGEPSAARQHLVASLRTLTGRRYGLDARAWRGFIAQLGYGDSGLKPTLQRD